MRRSLGLFLILFVLSAGVFGTAAGRLYGDREAVTVTETVLAGDKEAARGITVTNRTSCDNRLFWDTTYTVGGTLQAQTSYRFSPTPLYEEQEPRPSGGLSAGIGMGVGGTRLDVEQYGPPVVDVAARTPAGETREETLPLGDYFTYYPLSFYLSHPRLWMDAGREAQRAISDYFQIPVKERQELRVSIAKDKDGYVESIDYQTIADPVIYMDMAITDDGCYIVIAAGEPDALAQGVAGIHYLPLAGNESIGYRLDVGGMRQVYTMEDTAAYRPPRLLLDKDGRLLLLTADVSGSVLSVFDRETMRVAHTTELFVGTAGADCAQVKSYEDFLVLLFTDGSFFLLTEKDGGYEVDMLDDLFACEAVGRDLLFDERMEMDYDGRRLAVVLHQRDRVCGTYLLVYDDGGLAYAGQYDHSGDRTALAEEGFGPVNPAQARPLRVSCG